MIDELRGLMILLVCFYHLGYDLSVIFGFPMDWFWADWPVQFGRDCLVGTLLFISGLSCSLSSSNLRRGLRIFAIALAISAITSLFMPSERIVFGVLHCYGTCILLWAALNRFTKRAPAVAGVVVSLALFAALRFLPDGILQAPLVGRIRLPSALYANPLFFWLGLPGPRFFSADYYPILPWGLLIFAGGFAGAYFKRTGFPDWFYADRMSWLAFLGRHSLAIYLIHQPVILGILSLLFRFA